MTRLNMTQRFLWLGSIILTVVLLDQLTKNWIVDWIGPGRRTSRVEMLGSFFAFEYLENRGAAFGMFQQGTTVFALISVVVIIIGTVMMIRFAREDMLLAASVALVMGGAIGNAIDRFTRGFVVDFIAVGRFWKFNVADSAVTIGVIMTFLLLWRSDNARQSEESTQEQET